MKPRVSITTHVLIEGGFLLLLLALQPAAHAQFDYQTNGNAIVITKYTGPGGAVIVPETIGGLPVTAIGSFAFSGNSSLTSITIATSITNIGVAAFSYCSQLSSVVIPAGVVSIGAGAFAECGSLAAIVVDQGNAFYLTLEGVLFTHDQTTLVQYPGARIGSYSIPASVTTLGESAFGGCYNLTGITIPNGVSRIPDWAFDSCTGLTTVVIPNAITGIGYCAFRFCTSLTNATIGSRLTEIASTAFGGCWLLENVYFRGNAPSVEDYVFDGDNKLTVYYLPGTTGWGATLGGRPTAPWPLPAPVILEGSVGVRTNTFGFTISWASNNSVVVEASSNLAESVWFPICTNTLSGGWSYFNDPGWADYPGRFYRVRSPRSSP